MPSAYPGAVVALPAPTLGLRAAPPTEFDSVVALVDDMNALKTELGVNPSAGDATVADRLDGMAVDESTIQTIGGVRSAIAQPILTAFGEGATPTGRAVGDIMFTHRPMFTQTATTDGTTLVLVADSTNMVVGQGVSAANIPVGTVVATKVDATHITLSVAATAATGPLTFEGVTVMTTTVVAALKTQTINAQTGVAYTAAQAQSDVLVTLSNAAAITVTLPQDSDGAFVVGETIDFMTLGAGQVTWIAGTGATLRVSGLTAKSRAQFSRVSVQKIAASTWSLYGDLAAS